MDPINANNKDSAILSEEDSPEVIRELLAELEREISDTAEEESCISRRLGDVEEELVKKKEKELERNVERAEIERELLDATKERLKEIQEEQTNTVERLEAERVALVAKRRTREKIRENRETNQQRT